MPVHLTAPDYEPMGDDPVHPIRRLPTSSATEATASDRRTAASGGPFDWVMEVLRSTGESQPEDAPGPQL
jgi:hypothetical protein